MFTLENLYQKAIQKEFLSKDEGLFVFEQAPLSDLIFIADELRKKSRNAGFENKVGWIIDRNVNITNVCASQCKFCNFYRNLNDSDAYITSLEEYKNKIEFLHRCGGDQLLLQGGLHPKLGLNFYTELFTDLKKMFPDVKLHALGPAEIVHISKLSGLSFKEVLQNLIHAGLDSLPGAGAEILVDRVRKQISKAKCSSKQWLDVMREAHQLKLPTSATMMFGHIETYEERIEHLVKIREVQAEKPEDSLGFVTFVPWTFQAEKTVLNKTTGLETNISSQEYIRMVAVSRIMLPNIKNIQASWLTVGKHTAQVALHAGANDFGSIMIEENVVSAAGANNSMDAQGIQQAIREAGFEPLRRNQKYEFIEKIG